MAWMGPDARDAPPVPNKQKTPLKGGAFCIIGCLAYWRPF